MFSLQSTTNYDLREQSDNAYIKRTITTNNVVTEVWLSDITVYFAIVAHACTRVIVKFSPRVSSRTLQVQLKSSTGSEITLCSTD